MSDRNWTLVVAALCAALAAFSGWRGALPANPLKGPRLMPWRWLMLFATAAAVLALVHYLQLLRPYAAT